MRARVRTSRAGGRHVPPRVAFRCGRCGARVGDPAYHGPLGHAPANLCFDCWAGQWHLMRRRMRRGREWTHLDAALALLCGGFSYDETARIVGKTRRTVHNWIRRLRRCPHLVPDWLLDRRDNRPERGREDLQ